MREFNLPTGRTSIKCIACLFLLLAGRASASVEKYQFEAKIDSLFEYDNVTGSIKYVTSSDMPGNLISVGDNFAGWISYDTETALSPYSQPDPGPNGSYLIYVGGGLSSLDFNPSGLTYRSNPDTWGSIIQVADGASAFYGADVFSFNTASAWSPVEFSMMTVMMVDSTGQAFTSSAIPSQLALSAFSYTNVDYGWLRQSDGNQVHASGSLTSLTRVTSVNTVPEPGTLFLSAIGFGSLILTAYKRRRKKT
jgi:hypothetical protein